MMTFAERRRLVVVMALTVVLLPFMFVGGNGDDGSATTDPAASSVPAVPGVASDTEPANPAFLPVEGNSDAPEIITVNVPAPPEGTIVKGNATFIRWPQTMGLRPCATPVAVIGAVITVTNLNNGRSLTCDNVSIQTLTTGTIIVIHTELFIEIADLVDAPLAVEISF